MVKKLVFGILSDRYQEAARRARGEDVRVDDHRRTEDGDLQALRRKADMLAEENIYVTLESSGYAPLLQQSMILEK